MNLAATATDWPEAITISVMWICYAVVAIQLIKLFSR